MVKSAAAHGQWVMPNILSSPGDPMSAVALDETLEAAAIAQRLSQRYGLEILEGIRRRNKTIYRETAFKYAKYSGCDVGTQRELYKNVIASDAGSEAGYTKALAALELLRLDKNEAKDPSPPALVELVVDALVEIKSSQENIIRYWYLLELIEELLAEATDVASTFHEKFPEVIRKDFAEMELLPLKYSQSFLEHYYIGISMTPRESYYYFLNRSTKSFWCKTWRCCETSISK